MRNSNRIIAVLAAIGCVGTANADTSIESVTFDLQLPDFTRAFVIPEGSGDRTASRAIAGVPKFDPALGTLVDVAISFDFPFELDVEVEGDDIINPGAPHSASFTAGEIAIGVGFTDTGQAPPVNVIVGETIADLTVQCEGNSAPACSATEEQILTIATTDTSVAGSIPLEDFVGTGAYDGFSLQFEVRQPSFERNNVAAAIGSIDGSVDREFTSFSITYFYGSNESDFDSDGVADFADNCLEAPNPGQEDADADNIGNACDADITNDCTVNFGDLALLKAGFFPNFEPNADFDGNGNVDFGDLAFMKSTFFNGENPGPGPSGLPNDCDAD